MNDFHYGQESLVDIIKELAPMFIKHYDEVARYKDKIPLKPDYERMLLLEEDGILEIHTVRQGEDENLIGYSFWVLFDHLHYQGLRMANNDLLYILPELRHSGLADEFLAYSEEVLRESGVDQIIVRMKTNKTFESLLMGRDYDPFEITYSKYIGK